MKNIVKNMVRMLLVIGLLTPSFGLAISTSVCEASVKQSCMSANSGSGTGSSTGSTGVKIDVGTNAGGNVTAITTISQTCDEVAKAACAAGASSTLDVKVPVVP